jgi:peptide/nickel transport system substrate-binding protein
VSRRGAERILLGAILVLLWLPQQASAETKKTELVFALSGEPDSLDPQKTVGTLTFQVLKSIYDTLVEPDARGIIVPALAESWSVSPDALAWTFHLRKGVTFHNGLPLSSTDVKATFERFLSPLTAAPRAGELAALKSVVARDPLTVEFQLSHPSAPFLATLASGWSAILPAALIAAKHDFAADPVGTGPFVFSSWHRGAEILLTRNPSYWLLGLPRLDTVHMRFMVDDQAKIDALATGRVQAVDYLNGSALAQAQKLPSVRLQQKLSSMVVVLAFNCSRPPFTDARVRQAISMAIDKSAVLDTAYNGGKAVGTLMDFGSPYYADFTGLLPFDPERAKKLLAQAGFKKGTTLDLAVPGNYEPHAHAARIIRDQLARIGIDLRLRVLDWSTWLSSVYQGGMFDMTIIGQTGKLDPDGRLVGYGTSQAYVKWINSDVAQTVEKARTTEDPVARKSLYLHVLGILAREVPQVYIGTTMDTLITRTEVRDLRMTYALDSFDFRWTVLRP